MKWLYRLKAYDVQKAVLTCFVAMTSQDDKSRRLAVLLITAEVCRQNDVATVGYADFPHSDSETVDYVELLSAYNYSFDIITPENVQRSLLFDHDSINYSVIILATPLSRLTDSALCLIREVSHDAGITLIAAYDHPDERSAVLFGIEQFKGKGILWPLKTRIIQWPIKAVHGTCVADYGVKSSFPGVRRRGLSKLSWKQMFTKGLNLISSLTLPYMKADVAYGIRVLSSTMRGEPLAWSYRYGNATNYYFALHGDRFLDKYNEMHVLVRSAIEANSGYGMVSVGLDRAMVVRLDDPGSSKADYVKAGEMLNETHWNEVRKVLKEKGIPLSVMYTPGWVDDGDTRAGSLFIDNEMITDRTVGTVYDSSRVKYVPSDLSKSAHDHSSEYRGLGALVHDSLVDIHSHGLTHLVPDYGAWAAAKDRNTNSKWYVEFYHTSKNEAVADEVQVHAMVRSKDIITNLFKTVPAAITPSSHKHGLQCDVLAHRAGYKLFSSDYTGIMKGKVLIRNWKIPALFVCFKEPSSSICKAGYPVIGVVHDYEIKDNLNCFVDIIDKWSDAGIRKFISLNNLAASLCASIDARYYERESRIECELTLPESADCKCDGADGWGEGTEIAVRVVYPKRLSCEGGHIAIKGAVLVSVEQSSEAVNLLIRIIDAKSIKMSIPLICEELSQCAQEGATQVRLGL